MSHENEELPSKSICRTTYKTNERKQNVQTNSRIDFEHEMAPAANDHPCNSGIPLSYYSNSDSALASVNHASLKDQMSIAQALIRQQNHTTDEDKIAAIVAARQIEARKEQELELARVIRRHHEDEQIQKHFSSIRERGMVKPDCELMTLATSVGEDSATRLRNALQRKRQEELALLQSSGARGNEDDRFLHMQGHSRLLPLTGYGSGLLSLPTQALNIPSSSLSSRNPSFLANQACIAETLHERGNSQFQRIDFDSNRSKAILNALCSSKSSPVPSHQDIPALHKYFSGITGNSNLDNLLSGTNARAEWLRASSGGTSPTSPSQRHGKHALEGQSDLFVASKRLKTIEAASNGSEPEGEQQQKRFNKHQCKQWTLKFHELLAFKEKMGHCNVPHGYKANLALAMWVKRQRHQYNLMMEKKTSTLTGERIKLLENIGFVWNCLETAWDQHFQDLRAFVLRTGHCAVPSTYKRNPRLASWVVTQRRQCKLLEDGKQSSMTQKRLEKLKQIGFPIKTKKTGSTNKNPIKK